MHAFKMAALAAAVLATGCANLASVTDRDFAASQARIDQLKANTQQPAGTPAPVVAHDEGMWIARSAIKISSQERLPALFDQPATFDRTVSSLAEFAQRITLRAGFPVQVTPDAMAASQRALQGEQTEQRGAGGTPSAPVIRPPSPPIGGAAGNATTPVRITYLDGKFKGLLDTAAARFGVNWRYADSGVQFYFTDTRSFQIRAVPGDASLNATVGNNTATGSGGGSTTTEANGAAARSNAQNTAVSSRLSVFESIEKSVAGMLSAHGKVTASPATGTLSVTDTPEALKRVAQFIEDENQALSRQVMINVTVLAVAASDLDDYGIKWDLVYGDLSKRFGVSSTYNAQPGAATFSAAILNTASSKFAGSTLMMNALSTQGKVRRETSASVATLNNQPVPVQVARQTAYLKSSSTLLTANVGSTTTLEPGTVTSGFNMTILPHVLSNGTVMLQFATDISSLRSIRTVSSGGGSNGEGKSIETPEVDTRNFLQRVAMKSGETLVISGFEQTDSNVDRSGIGEARFFGLGGGVRAGSSKEVIVILITPIAMSGA